MTFNGRHTPQTTYDRVPYILAPSALYYITRTYPGPGKPTYNTGETFTRFPMDALVFKLL